jgi:D-beta-D-heptose 7-phosphate kinase/D-beta-D-heptose 1-phosphate adenosyltransferase
MIPDLESRPAAAGPAACPDWARLGLKDLAEQFRGKRVLVLGDVMLDEYIWGTVRRVSPEAPVPVVEFDRRTHGAGGAANVAANVTSLGGRALLAGVVGADPAAELLAAALRAHGIESPGLLVDAGRPTTTKTRVLAHNQQIARLDCERRGPLPPDLEDALLRCVEPRFGTADAYILSDYAKGVVSPRLAQRFLHAVRPTGKPVVVDPKGTDYAKYRGATVVKPNLREVEDVFNCTVTAEDDLHEAARRLLEVLAGAALLVTQGPQGMTLFRDGHRPWHAPALARRIFDGTGAGDTVTATLALALAAGASLEQAAILATRAAAVVVGKVGTAQVTPGELLSEEGLARPG